MNRDLNKKLNELFCLLDKNENMQKIAKIKESITNDELALVNEFRLNPTIENKKKLYYNPVISDYLVCENNINYLIMNINSKFKRSKFCESNKR